MSKDYLVNETELGVAQMVEDLERCYRKSCEHNGVDKENLEYMRRYIFNMIAMIIDQTGKRSD